MTPRAEMPEWSGDAEAFVDGLLRWLAEAGKTRYDAEVTQLEHALQTAARAVEDGADDEAIDSALLHDVGHLVIGEHRGRADFLQRDEGHEAVGARWLARALPPSVTRPVGLHVPAKRYLCAIEPAYWHGLSVASKASLELQGGPLGEDEARTFAALSGAETAARLRRWDDRGKVAGAKVPGLETHRDRLLALVGPRDAEGA